MQVKQWAQMYDAGSIPSISEQTTFLASLSTWFQSDQVARSKWRPMYGLWSGWVALACIVSSIAFVVVNKVTKARLIFAKRHASAIRVDNHARQTSPASDTDKYEENNDSSTVASEYVRQARSDYITLSLQFSMATILMAISEIMLLWVTIRGYDVHTNPDLLATALIVPPLAYLLQASVALGLIIVSQPHSRLRIRVNPVVLESRVSQIRTSPVSSELVV